MPNFDITILQSKICQVNIFFLTLPKIYEMDITNNIKLAIKAHGFTSTEVANKLGILQPQFSRLINNPNIKVADLEKIADAIGCSVVDLVDPSLNNEEVQRFCPFCGKKIR